jgi:carbon storage regulator
MLSRKLGERIVINENIIVEVVAVSGNRVRLGISAPIDAPIRRAELLSNPPAGAPVAVGNFPTPADAALCEFNG